MTTQLLIPEQYEGREQARVKHHVLEKYLEKLTAILGVSNRVFEFTYIDCFAGPWEDDSSDIASTSIAISLQVLARCKQAVEARGSKAVIRALYVEKSSEAFARLKHYLEFNTPNGIETKAIHGEFVQSRNEMLTWVGIAGYAFFFIDPKGYSEVKVGVLQPLLARPRSEFVINFMYDFVNRAMSMERHKQEMEELVGEALDLSNTEADRELSILNTYRKNLKRLVTVTSSNFQARSAYISVLDPRKARTKYHLVYLTTHPKGIVKFMETCEESSQLQDLMRAKIRDDKKKIRTGMTDLFSEETPFVNNQKSKIETATVDQYWLSYIGQGRRVSESDFAEILEETNWFPGELFESLVRLIEGTKISNMDAKKARPKKPLHFDKPGGELLTPATSL